jgi:cytochrome c553
MKKTAILLTAVSFLSTAAFAANTAVCAGCHGKDFEKAAMGQSKIVKDMSKEDIIAALKAYKAGTGGHSPMKGVMQGQAKGLSDADIEAIAEQIAGGKKEAKNAADEVVDAAKSAATDAAKEAANKAVDTAKDKAVEKAAGMLK